MDGVSFISLWKVAISVAGLGAIGCLVFLSLYKQWLSLKIFSQLTKKQTFALMRWFLVLTFLFSITALTFFFFQDSSEEDPHSEVRMNLSNLDMNTAVNKACILFAPDQSDLVMLPEQYMERLFQQFYRDAMPPLYEIGRVTGFAHPATDFRSTSTTHAIGLSERRARQVQDYLVSRLNISPSAIVIEGMGFDNSAEMVGPYICGAKLRSS